MARSYAKVLAAIWRDTDFTNLPGDVQRMYFLLLSQHDLSSAGVLPLRISKWAKLAADTTPDDISRALSRLAAGRFVLIDDDTEEVLIRSFIRHDGGFGNDNIRKAIVKAVENIESEALRAVATVELGKAAGDTGSEGDSNAVSTPFEGHSNSSSQQPATAAFNQQPQPAAPDPTNAVPAAAAAAVDRAIDLVVQHRLDTEKVNNTVRYSATTAERIRAEHAPALAALDLDQMGDELEEQARWIATRILGLTRTQAITAAVHLRNRKGAA